MLGWYLAIASAENRYFEALRSWVHVNITHTAELYALHNAAHWVYPMLPSRDVIAAAITGGGLCPLALMLGSRQRAIEGQSYTRARVYKIYIIYKIYKKHHFSLSLKTPFFGDSENRGFCRNSPAQNSESRN